MNRHIPQHPSSRAARPLRRRIGMTLTEVLMALMVMGIGLVSVITLFPLAILRSVEATKLTNATATRINAEAKIKASVSSNDTGSSLEVIKSAILYDPDGDGVKNQVEKFVFDPLGAVILNNDGHPTPNRFGDRQVDGIDIPRYRFDLNTQAAAQEFVTSPDSFISLFDGVAGSDPGTFVQPAAGASQIFLNGLPLHEYRDQQVQVTLISVSDGSAVIKGTTRVDTATTPNTHYVELNQPIPARAVPDRLIVDLPERRYTWIATVRNIGSSPSTSVAVFFRRSFSPEDERVYDVMKRGRHTYFINDSDLNPNALPPGFKQGGWMFDLDNFRWWKITQLKRDNASNGYWIATDPEEFDDGKPPKHPPIQVVFPGNIVEVYNLKKG